MDVQQFLAGREEAVNRMSQSLHAAREAMARVGTPPECITFVLGQLGPSTTNTIE